MRATHAALAQTSHTRALVSALSAQAAWAPGPRRPQLADGAVHVWRADLAAAADDLAELLCEEERARAERIVSARRAELWRRSRGLLRELLGRYLRREPRTLRFALGEHGKPALILDGEDRVPFNMSHSGSVALYAFSGAGEIGVDVEVARRTIDEVAVAHRTLGRPTAERLEGLDPDTRRREFLRAWARHEAALKCLGVGIGGTQADVGAAELWVVELELGHADTAGAVAVEGRARELRCWQWPS
jgi:4'-phosphopantetheinyl transferase